MSDLLNLVEKLDSFSTLKYKKYIETQELSQLHSVKLYLDDLYYNSDTCSFSDMKYDLLKEILQKRDPTYTPPIGAKIRIHDNRAKLEYHMGSADKITPENENVLHRWFDKNPSSTYNISEKLDGVSGLFVHKGGKNKLYTRGDGKTGADISYLIQFFSSIPKKLPKDIVVRGEIIITKNIFNNYKPQGDKKTCRTYKNPRNMVSGLIGGKTVRQGLKCLSFVAYEIVGESTMPCPSSQIKQLQKIGFTTVNTFELKKETFNIKTLTKIHNDMKNKSDYEIDGIIVQSNIQYDRNTTGNPEYLFAFKVRSKNNIAITEVIDMEWSVSKWGQIIPVAITKPVLLAGATLSRFTCHNGANVIKHNIGPGATVTVTRSNEVIPFIMEIIHQCPKNELKLPSYKYTWDKNKVHMIVESGTAEKIMRIKLFSSFFEKLGIKHVNQATVEKMYDHGIDTLLKIITAERKQLAEIEGIKEKSADRIVTNIQKGLENVSIPLLLGASGVFGFGIGRKRIILLLTDIPNFLSLPKKGLKNRVLKVEGFSEIMADKVVSNIDNANKFLKQLEKHATFKKDKRISDSLVAKKFVFSGFRDKKLEQDITERGGSISSSVSKKTTCLVISDSGEKMSSKTEKAKNLGVQIYTKQKFILTYINS